MSENDDSLEQRIRVCRKCSTQSTAAGNFCPECGTPYVARRRKPSRRAAAVVLAVVVLAVGGGATAAVLVGQAQAHEEERAEQRAERAAERERNDEQIERDYRAGVVEEIEKSLTKDARGLVKDGVFEGPIEYSSCTATGQGSADDLTAITGTFECMAVNEEKEDGTVSGYSYSVTADWDEGSYQWQLGN